MEGLSRVVHTVDASTAALIVTNIGVLALALYQQGEIGTVLWINWSQSVIIGFFQFFKILSLRQFTTDGMTSNGMPVAPTRQSLRSLAGFFAVHYYGFFHLGYMAFLWTEVPLTADVAPLVLPGGAPLLLQPRPLLRPELPGRLPPPAAPGPRPARPLRPDRPDAPRHRLLVHLPERVRARPLHAPEDGSRYGHAPLRARGRGAGDTGSLPRIGAGIPPVAFES
ncbi:MAG: DUF6498-containing protein [Methanomicrobiales archaeon]|nr:DUF6498-containing protein [Methanomicrobiales archaeon]